MRLTVRTSLIRRHLCNPVRYPPWEGHPVRPGDVQAALRETRFRPTPLKGSALSDPIAHAERIAWLAYSGWEDPIEIDVGVPSHGCYPSWPVLDGNHRLYAAFVSRRFGILAEIGGEIDYAIDILALDPVQVESALSHCVAEPV